MRQLLAAVLVVASAWVPANAALAQDPAVAPSVSVVTPAPRTVIGRTNCAGAVQSVRTNLVGPSADRLEAAQAVFEDIEGFRAVVDDGEKVIVIVAPESIATWRKLDATAGWTVAPSCVPTALLAEAQATVEKLGISAGGFSSVGYDALQDSVSIITTEPNADALVDRVADDRVASLVHIEAAAKEDFALATRNSDSPPFWGGARIKTSTGSCSSGMYLNSQIYGTVMLTAGHCADGNGDTVSNGDLSRTVGHVEGWHLADPDVALIDGSTYDNWTYSSTNQTSSRPIQSSADPTTGVVYCQVGATSLLVCSAYSSLDATATTSTGTTHHLAYTSGPAGPSGSLGSGGDSGGGVFRDISDGSFGARGMVIAAGCNQTTCARWDHKIGTITNYYSAAVVLQ